jgi:hypothetical protein
VLEYLVFRIVRSYFTLAAVLSLRYDPIGPPWRRSRTARHTAVLFEPDGHRDT